MLVAFAMLLLPALYLALVAGFAYGVWYYGTEVFPATFAYTSNGQALAVAAIPIPAGLIAIVFLLKPFLGRLPSPPAPLSISPDDAPELFGLVSDLCDALGAPHPRRIDADVRVNAAAGFRSPWLGLMTSDLVLTIGLPLVDGLTLRQFTGVLAHEFGHFAQGAGMRLGLVIRLINGWFAGVVFGRDHWDARLHAWRTGGHWIVQLLGLTASGCVWVSRSVLRLLMIAGHTLSMLLSRQMEFDADQAEARAVGSHTFVETSKRLHVLDLASQWAHSDLGVAWRMRRLGDDFPALIRANLRQLPQEKVEAMLEGAMQATPSMYASHPSTEQRIARASSPHWEGVFAGDGDARALFADFKAVCVAASLHYYERLLPGEFTPDLLTSSEAVADLGEKEAARRRARLEYFGHTFDAGCWFTASVLDGVTPDADAAVFAASRSELAVAARAREQYNDEIGRLFTLQRVQAIVAAQVPLQASEVGLPDVEPQTVATALRQVRLQCDAYRADIASACPHLRSHLAACWAHAPAEAVSTLEVLNRAESFFTELAADTNALSALVALEASATDRHLAAVRSLTEDRVKRALAALQAVAGRLLDDLPPHLDLLPRAHLALDQVAARHDDALGQVAMHALQTVTRQAELAPTR